MKVWEAGAGSPWTLVFSTTQLPLFGTRMSRLIFAPCCKFARGWPGTQTCPHMVASSLAEVAHAPRLAAEPSQLETQPSRQSMLLVLSGPVSGVGSLFESFEVALK